jgi:predicted GIY-YIG superfamily endonuclease
VASWSAALREEIRIKALRRPQKEELVGGPDDGEPPPG